MSRSGPARPQGVIAAVVVLVALVAIGFAVVIGIRLGGSYLGEQTATGPAPTNSEATTTRTPPKPRIRTTETTTTRPTTTRRATADCDARTINADLGYPDSGARIIDCGSGWAVMASEHSGDPYWVSFRGGRWQTERSISMYLMTCPDEAIARGAPAWMADRHLTCQSRTPTTSATRSSARPPTPRPSVPPSVRPSPSPSPSSTSGTSSVSSSPSASPTQTSEETTTTTPSSPAPEADVEELE